MSDAAIVAKRLKGFKAGDGYLCRCPVPSHGRRKGDRNPSLSIRDGDVTGRILLHCFAGCDPRDVSTLLRRERAGLFPRRVRLGPRHHGYRLKEVRAWVQARFAERDAPQREAEVVW